MQLDDLVRDAKSLGDGTSVREGMADESRAEDEVARIMQICNACRYCEGFCAVFPAMTRRLEFPRGDVHYLANLCHNCGACFHACQYAPPHEFAVNVPKAMAEVRLQTYVEYAWPAPLGALYRRNALTCAVAAGACLALFLILGLAGSGSLWRLPTAGNFYAVFPHNLMVALFAPVFAFACLALGIGVTRFWRDVGKPSASAYALREAGRDALRLKYLDGGHGEGCNEADDRFSLWRRRFHHFTFYGFMLCFAATCVATVYHYLLGWHAPYALSSTPVLLGTAGGIGLVIGTPGLFWLNIHRDPRPGDPAQRGMDLGLIALLFATGATGLALLVLRETSAMALLLAAHLGFVAAFFLTMPYGKFAHGVYRFAALLMWAVERRQPNPSSLGAE